MEAIVHLRVDLFAALMFMNGLLFMFAPAIYRWNRDVRFAYMPWYVQPTPGSFRAWVERPRPRLCRYIADALTTFLLFAACKLLVVLAMIVERVLPIM